MENCIFKTYRRNIFIIWEIFKKILKQCFDFLIPKQRKGQMKRLVNITIKIKIKRLDTYSNHCED